MGELGRSKHAELPLRLAEAGFWRHRTVLGRGETRARQGPGGLYPQARLPTCTLLSSY